MKFTSSAFKDGESIPKKYTCEGENINPPFTVSHVPKEAKALVLIMDDPDVPEFVNPEKIWDHWVVFNIPPTLENIEENQNPPGLVGQNTSGNIAYEGPCPPDKEHRYFFKLYAISRLLNLPEGATKKQVERAMNGLILSEVHLMGRYRKTFTA